MGEARGTLAYPLGQYAEFRRRVHEEIDRMLATVQDDELGTRKPARRTFGNETEIVLVDSAGQPMRIAPYIIGKGRDRGHNLVLELLLHQVEANGLVLPFSPSMFEDYMRLMGNVLGDIHDIATTIGGQLGLFGVMPSLSVRDILPGAMTTDNPRFLALAYHLQRDLGSIRIHQRGIDLETDNFCIAGIGNAEQTHCSVPLEELVDTVNAAQMAASLVVAATAGSPVVLGQRVGAEGRIPLFTGAFRQQPTLGPCVKKPGGEATWVYTARQVLEYSLTFRLIMPELADTPISEAWHWRFCNGLTHPWICPTYYPSSHMLGIETRSKSAGPTLIDQAINHALDLALTAAIKGRIAKWIAAGFSYHWALSNFSAAAQYGLEALVHWPDSDGNTQIVPIREVILDLLESDAVLALANMGVGMKTSRWILALARTRIRTGRTAAHWISHAVDLDACDSWEIRLAQITLLYLKRSDNGRSTTHPVHTWPLASVSELTP